MKFRISFIASVDKKFTCILSGDEEKKFQLIHVSLLCMHALLDSFFSRVFFLQGSLFAHLATWATWLRVQKVENGMCSGGGGGDGGHFKQPDWATEIQREWVQKQKMVTLMSETDAEGRGKRSKESWNRFSTKFLLFTQSTAPLLECSPRSLASLCRHFSCTSCSCLLLLLLSLSSLPRVSTSHCPLVAIIKWPDCRWYQLPYMTSPAQLTYNNSSSIHPSLQFHSPLVDSTNRWDNCCFLSFFIAVFLVNMDICFTDWLPHFSLLEIINLLFFIICHTASSIPSKSVSLNLPPLAVVNAPSIHPSREQINVIWSIICACNKIFVIQIAYTFTSVQSSYLHIIYRISATVSRKFESYWQLPVDTVASSTQTIQASDEAKHVQSDSSV